MARVALFRAIVDVPEAGIRAGDYVLVRDEAEIRVAQWREHDADGAALLLDHLHAFQALPGTQPGYVGIEGAVDLLRGVVAGMAAARRTPKPAPAPRLARHRVARPSWLRVVPGG